MKRGIFFLVGVVFALLFSACGGAQATSVPTEVPPVQVDMVVIKKVAIPTDRNNDFAVVELDGSYTVRFDESTCITDDKPYMYGPYDSIKHCEMFDPGVLQGIISDQAWLQDDLAGYVPYLNCIHGWVYLGRTSEGKEKWFVEGFGFPAFCPGT